MVVKCVPLNLHQIIPRNRNWILEPRIGYRHVPDFLTALAVKQNCGDYQSLTSRPNFVGIGGVWLMASGRPSA